MEKDKKDLLKEETLFPTEMDLQDSDPSFVTVPSLLSRLAFVFQASSGYFVVVFVYVMEIIGKKARTWASIHLNTFFAIGAMLVALASYLLKTWWLYQIILCIVTTPFILCCWMLPETPFWLLSEGRYKEAQGTVDTMAVWNKSSSCDLVELLSLDVTRSHNKSPHSIRKHRLADLFHNLDVAKMTLIVWLDWFTANLGYYMFGKEVIRRKENEPLYLLLVGKRKCVFTYGPRGQVSAMFSLSLSWEQHW